MAHIPLDYNYPQISVFYFIAYTLYLIDFQIYDQF